MSLAGRPALPDAQKEQQGTARAHREQPGGNITAEPLAKLPPPPGRFRAVLGKADRELEARGLQLQGDGATRVGFAGLNRLERLNGLAREAWRRFGLQSIERCTLTAGDLPALEVLAWTWARMVQLDAEIALEGSTVQAFSGEGKLVGTYTNPKVGEMERAHAEVQRWLAHFGLTPLARGRVRTAGGKKAEENPFAALRARMTALKGGRAGGHAQEG